MSARLVALRSSLGLPDDAPLTDVVDRALGLLQAIDIGPDASAPVVSSLLEIANEDGDEIFVDGLERVDEAEFHRRATHRALFHRR